MKNGIWVFILILSLLSFSFSVQSAATGGTISYVQNPDGSMDKVHVFNNSGTFTVPINTTLQSGWMLVIGGGGAGGFTPTTVVTGGGGAGGFSEQQNMSFTDGDYDVVVGAGGNISTSSSSTGGNGGDSSVTKATVEILSADGGGGGGSVSQVDGGNGGSGGGGAEYSTTGSGGTGIVGQGYDGADGGGTSADVSNLHGGGGGGAGGSPPAFTSATGQAGGPGKESLITGISVYYAGGGSGGRGASPNPVGAGGIGGGGTGAGGSGAGATAGSSNTGGGGGGGSDTENGAEGGSGVVIIRYRDTYKASITAGDNLVRETGKSSVLNPVVIKILRSDDQPASNVPVNFSYNTSPPGTFTNASLMSNASGEVILSGWQLVDELNTINASIAGGPVLTITGYGVPSFPSNIESVNAPSLLKSGELLGSPLEMKLVDSSDAVVELSQNEMTVVAVAVDGTSNFNLLGDRDIQLADGIANFPDLRLQGIVGKTYRLNFRYIVDSISTETGSFDVQINEAGDITELQAQIAPVAKKNGEGFGNLVFALKDVMGNTVVNALGNVEASITLGSVTLDGTTSVALNSGVATFDNLSVRGINGENYTIEFKYTDGSGNSFTKDYPLSITGFGTPTDLIFDTIPDPGRSGIFFDQDPVVSIRDSGGNLVDNVSDVLKLELKAADGSAVTDSASLGGILDIPWSTGVATYSQITLNGIVGTNYQMLFSYTPQNASSPLELEKIVQVAGPGNVGALIVHQQPTADKNAADLSTQPIIYLVDEMGNKTTSTDSVTASMLASSTARLTGGDTVAAVGGEARFVDLGIEGNLTDSYQITFTSGSYSDISAGFQIQAPGDPSKLVVSNGVVSSVPSGGILGDIQLELQDVSDNVIQNPTESVEIEISGATLNSKTPQPFVSNVATFSGLSVTGTNGAGYDLLFTYPMTGGVNDIELSVPLTISGAGTPSQLDFDGAPAAGNSGSTFSAFPKLVVKDNVGNTVVTAGGTVSVKILASDGLPVTDGANLDGGVDESLNQGVAEFTTLILNGKLGVDYILRFTYIPSGGSTPIEKDITVSVTGPGDVASLIVATEPEANVNADALSIPAVIRLLDSIGNLTTSTAEVVASLQMPSTATLTAGQRVNAVAGVATFDGLVIQGTVGDSYVLDFNSINGATDSSAGFDIKTAGAPTVLVLKNSPIASTASGLPLGDIEFELHDASANVIENPPEKVSISISSGVTLNDNTPQSFVGNVATFSGLEITGSNGASYTLTFSYPTTSGTALDKPIALSITGVGNPSQLNISRLPIPAESGEEFSQQPIIEVQDAGGNTVTLAGGELGVTLLDSVSAAVTDGARLEGTQDITLNQGKAEFTNLKLFGKTSTTYTLRFSYTPQGKTTTITKDQAVSVTGAGAVFALLIQQQPGANINRQALIPQPIIALHDSMGNLVTTSTEKVTASLVGQPPGDVTNFEVTAAGGVATFSALTLNGEVNKDYVITFTSINNSEVESDPIQLQKWADPYKLSVATPPVAGLNGDTFTTPAVLHILDMNNNLVEDATNSVDVAIINGQAGDIEGSPVMAVDGVVDFKDLILKGKIKVPYDLQFTSTGLLPAPSQEVTLTGSGNATKLHVSVQPLAVRSGTDFDVQPIISLYDETDNLVEADDVEITVTLASGLTAKLDGVTAKTVKGVAKFTNLNITGLVDQDYELTFTSSTNLTVQQTVRLSQAGEPASLEIQQPLTAPVNRVAFSPQPSILIKDSEGNVVKWSKASITAEVDNGGGLTGEIAQTPVDGIAAFSNLTLNGLISEQYTITFSIINGPSIPSQAITLAGPSTPEKLAVVIPPVAERNDTPMTQFPVVQVQDLDGNHITNSTALIGVVVDGNGQLNMTEQAAVGGNATFTGLQLNGTIKQDYVLTFSSLNLSDASSSPFQMDLAGAPVRLNVRDPQPVAGINGATFTTPAMVEILDVDGNFVNDATNQVTANVLNDSTGNLEFSTATASAGLADFSLMTLSGNVNKRYELQFTSLNLDAAEADPVILAGPSTAHQLALARPISGGKSGTVFNPPPEILVQDSNGNLVTTSKAAITVSVTGGLEGVLEGETASAVDGKAVFSSLVLIGLLTENYQLTFSSPETTEDAVVDNIQLIEAGDPYELVIDQPPVLNNNGDVLSPPPSLFIKDRQGNTVSGNSALVTVKISSAGGGIGELQGDKVFASQGVATFDNLVVNGVLGEKYTLTFESASLQNAVVSDLSFSGPGVPAKLIITQQPNAITSSEPFIKFPSIGVEDANGNLVSSTQIPVSVALVANGVNAKLNGTKTKDTTLGNVTFDDLVVFGAVNESYSLSFTSPNTKSVESAQFTLLEEGVVHGIAIESGDAQSGFIATALPLAPTVKFVDEYNNPVEGIKVSFVDLGGEGYATIPNAVSDANGFASAGQWVLGRQAGLNQLQATSVDLPNKLVNFKATAEKMISTEPYFGVQGETIGSRFTPAIIPETGQPISAGGVAGVLSLRDSNDAPLTDNSSVKSVDIVIASGPGILMAGGSSGRSLLINNTVDDPFYDFEVFSSEPGITVVNGIVTLQDGTQKVLADPMIVKFVQDEPGTVGEVRIITQPRMNEVGELTTQPKVGLYNAAGVLQKSVTGAQINATLFSGEGTLFGNDGTTTITTTNGEAAYTQLQLSVVRNSIYRIAFFSEGYAPAISEGMEVKSAAEIIQEDVENILLRDLKGQIENKQNRFKTIAQDAMTILRGYQEEALTNLADEDNAVDCLPTFKAYDDVDTAPPKIKRRIKKRVKPQAMQLFDNKMSMFEFLLYRDWIKSLREIQQAENKKLKRKQTPDEVLNEFEKEFESINNDEKRKHPNIEESKKGVKHIRRKPNKTKVEIANILSTYHKKHKNDWFTYANNSPQHWLNFPERKNKEKKNSGKKDDNELAKSPFNNLDEYVKFVNEEGGMDIALLDITNSPFPLDHWLKFKKIYQQVKAYSGNDVNFILDVMSGKKPLYVDEYEEVIVEEVPNELLGASASYGPDDFASAQFGYLTVPDSCYLTAEQVAMLADESADMHNWRAMPSDKGEYGAIFHLGYGYRQAKDSASRVKYLDSNIKVDVSENLTIKQFELAQNMGWNYRINKHRSMGMMLGLELSQSLVEESLIHGQINALSFNLGTYGAYLMGAFGLDYYLTMSGGLNQYELDFDETYDIYGAIKAKGEYQYVGLLIGLNASLARSQLYDLIYIQPNFGLQSAFAWTPRVKINAEQNTFNSDYLYDMKDYLTNEIYFELPSSYIFYTKRDSLDYMIHTFNIDPQIWYGENSLDKLNLGYGFTIDYSVLYGIHKFKVEYSERKSKFSNSHLYNIDYSADLGIGFINISTEFEFLNQNEIYNQIEFRSAF